MSPLETATHYLPNKQGRVQLYYRATKGEYNTGEEYSGLEYFSPDFQTWRGTNERNPEIFAKERLIKIGNRTRAFYNHHTKKLEFLD